MMNPDYQKGKRRKPTTGQKKDPPNKKAAPSKKTCATRTESNAESENKKRLGSTVNFDILDKLFDAEKSPKRAKLEKPVVVVGDQMEYSKESNEESLLKPQGTEEEEEPDWNEDYNNEEDAYGIDEETYGNAYIEIEDQEEEEEFDDEEIIW